MKIFFQILKISKNPYFSKFLPKSLKIFTLINLTVLLSPRKSIGKHCACTSSDSIGSLSDIQLKSVNDLLLLLPCCCCCSVICKSNTPPPLTFGFVEIFRLLAAESLRALGGVQYKAWSTSQGVIIIFWARSRIRPNWPFKRCRRIVCVRLLLGQFSSTQSWTAASNAASSLGQGKEPEIIWS